MPVDQESLPDNVKLAVHRKDESLLPMCGDWRRALAGRLHHWSNCQAPETPGSAKMVCPHRAACWDRNIRVAHVELCIIGSDLHGHKEGWEALHGHEIGRGGLRVQSCQLHFARPRSLEVSMCACNKVALAVTGMQPG